MLNVASYLTGVVTVLVTITALAVGARSVRTAAMPSWLGPRAWLAEIVIALAVLLAVAQLMGAVHLLRPLPVLAAELVAGVAMVVLGDAWASGHRNGNETPKRHVPGWELAAAGAVVGVVVVQWTTHVVYALRHGMTHSDTLWYHAPFAARFVQRGSLADLDGVGFAAGRLYPLDGSLLHSLGMLAFDRDVLSPLINLGWMLLALLAAWCIGRRRGVPHVAMVAAAVMIGLPMMTATQPGQAATDIAALALFLAGVALLVESDLQPAPLAVAGLAFGMALSTKLTVAVPVAVIAIGVFVLGRRARWAWTGALVATGTFWFVRDWVVAGSPIPKSEGQPALFHGIGNGDAWRLIYVPGLWQSLGRVWPAIVAILVISIVVVVVRGTGAERVVGVALAAGACAYVFTPYTGGFNFFSGLRFLEPMLVTAAVLVATRLRPTITLAVALPLVLVNVTMPNRERVPAFPGGASTVILVVTIVAVVVLVARRPRVLAPVALVAALVGGWFVQRTFEAHRYVDVGLVNDPLDAYFHDVRHATVAVAGTDDTYPLFGVDLSNDVYRADDPLDFDYSSCRAWRERLRGADYVAIATVTFGFYPVPPASVFDDADAVPEVKDGATSVYLLRRDLDPRTCPN